MNWDLLNRIEYSNPRMIKMLLLNYDGLVRMAEKGDQVALCIIVDLRTAIRQRGVLTKKQRKYLALWLDGQTQEEIATRYNITFQAVSYVINYGLVRVSKYLR